MIAKRTSVSVWLLFLLLGFGFQKTGLAEGADCNCNYPGQLEITSVNIGQGDATLIATPTKIMLADLGESYWNSHNDAEKVHSVIQEKYGPECKCIDYVLISHIHLDHIGYIKPTEDENEQLLNEHGLPYQPGDNLLNPQYLGGLAYLIKNLGYEVGETLFRDYLNHNPNKSPEDGGSKTFRNWKAYLLSPDGINSIHPIIAQFGESQINLGIIDGQPVIIDIIQVDGATPSNPGGCDPAVYFGGSEEIIRGDLSKSDPPPSENDLSISFILSFGDFQFYLGGDASGENYTSEFGYRYHDVETCLASDPIIMNQYGGHLEVLRVNHHGSSHSTNEHFLQVMNPQVAIFSVGDHNTYGHVDGNVLARVLKTVVGHNSGKVFMTECGDNIVDSNNTCLPDNPQWCAIIVDNEFPENTESNEAGDENVDIIVSRDGSSFNVENFAFSSIPSYNKSLINEAIIKERSKWDVKGDDKIGLEEAIRALQITSGVRPE